MKNPTEPQNSPKYANIATIGIKTKPIKPIAQIHMMNVLMKLTMTTPLTPNVAQW